MSCTNILLTEREREREREREDLLSSLEVNMIYETKMETISHNTCGIRVVSLNVQGFNY